MKFDIITIFPKIFDSYLNESMIKRAQAKKLVDIRIHDLREFALNKHKKVDDRPYGGGPGMVLKVEPLIKVISSILQNKSKKDKKIKIILFSAAGKQFDGKMAANWAKQHRQLVMIAGHYEGVDERVRKIFKLEEISIGPYVLTGGELPALIMVDAVSRHLPGFLGKEQSLEEKRLGVGVPMYTRPEIFFWQKKKYKVPEVLISGDHKKITEWRKSNIKKKPVYRKKEEG